MDESAPDLHSVLKLTSNLITSLPLIALHHGIKGYLLRLLCTMQSRKWQSNDISIKDISLLALSMYL